MAKRDIGELRDAAASAIDRGKVGKALALYAELVLREPESPTWPKRIGETHRRENNAGAAVAAFERAAEKYLQAGFLIQAIAVCKLIIMTHPQVLAYLAELTARRAPGTVDAFVDSHIDLV
jgi:hypothetical protein